MVKEHYKSVERYQIGRVSSLGEVKVNDEVVVEEVIELVVSETTEDVVDSEHALVMTLCTPNHVLEMTYGYLFSEGLIETVDDVVLEQFFDEPKRVFVKFKRPVAWQHHVRKHLQHAGCGLCSKQFLDNRIEQPLTEHTLNRFRDLLTVAFMRRVNQRIQARPSLFEQTGACHAAAAFDVSGQLLGFNEDVGRHNAVDKLVGALLLQKLNLSQSILWVSGRAGFELVNKAVRARFPMMISVGAPSSASVALARQQRMLLVGFVKDDGFNCYSPV